MVTRLPFETNQNGSINFVIPVVNFLYAKIVDILTEIYMCEVSNLSTAPSYFLANLMYNVLVLS